MKSKIIYGFSTILLFLIWLTSMFLPSSFNFEKYHSEFGLEKGKENFFYFLFHLFPVVTISFILLLLAVIGLVFMKKYSRANKLALLALILYGLGLIIWFPLSFIFQDENALANAQFFWVSYGEGYIIVTLIGLLFMISFWKFISSIQKTTD